MSAFLIGLAMIALGVAILLTVVVNDIAEYLRNLDVYDGPHCRECGCELAEEYRLGMCPDCQSWYSDSMGEPKQEVVDA